MKSINKETNKVLVSIPHYKDNITIKFEQTFPENSDQLMNFDNLADIPLKNVITDMDILTNIMNRSIEGNYFTEIDNVLLILNTFSNLDSVYNSKQMSTYKDCSSSSDPHLYKTMRLVLNELFNRKINQTILFQGVSGSGKTTSFIQSISYVVEMFSETKYITDCPIKKEGIDIGMAIAKSLNIIKAFGSAFIKGKVPKSRYICNFKLSISSIYKKIKGGEIKFFLLDKDRVFQENTDESNYLIFYYLLNADTPLIHSLFLSNDFRNYKFLDIVNNGFFRQTPVLKNRFQNIQESFEALSFSKETISTIYKILAAIIQLGNLPLEKKELTNKRSTGDINYIAKLLGVTPDYISNILIKSDYYGNAMKDTKNIPESKVIYQRNVFAKELYSRLVDWIIMLINNTINCIPVPKSTSTEKLKICNLNFLDIGGYEDNSKGENNIDQLCLNYLNEKMNQIYSENYIQKQIELYKREELIETAKLFPYYDYKESLSFLENNINGLLPLINQVKDSNVSNEMLFEIIKNNCKIYDGILILNTNKMNSFTINHTEGSVTYHLKDMIKSNVDPISPIIYECISSSIIEEIQMAFFNCIDYSTLGWKKRKIIDDIYDSRENRQLIAQTTVFFNQILKEITAKNVKIIFIKCIRSNNKLEGTVCSQKEIFSQIKFLDLLNTIMLVKQNYQINLPFLIFYENFRDILDPNMSLPHNVQDKCMVIINNLLSDKNSNAFLLGKFNIFFKTSLYRFLIDKKEEMLKDKLIKANMIKKHLLRYIKQNKWKNWVHQAKIIQAFSRKRKEKIVMVLKIIKVVFIQKKFRRYLNYKKYQKYIYCIVIIQKYARRFLMKNTLKYINTLTTIFIPLCRRFLYRSKESKKLQIKLLFNYIFNAAFKIIVSKWEYSASSFINANIKRYLFQMRNKKLMRKVRAIALECGKHGSATKLQSFFRAQRVFMKYHTIRFATCFIRLIWRGRSKRRMFIYLKNNSIMIQRFFRRFWAKKSAYNTILPIYLEDNCYKIILETVEIVRLLMLNQNYFINAFSRHNVIMKEKNNKSRNRAIMNSIRDEKQDSSKDTTYKSSRINIDIHHRAYSMGNYLLSKENENLNKGVLPEYLSFKDTKIRFFTVIIDLDLITTSLESYDEFWIKTYNHLSRYNIAQGTPIQLIKLGDNYTCVVNSLGKCYIWGQSVINDIVANNENNFFDIFPYCLDNKTNREDYIFKLAKQFGKIQDVICGNNHCFMLSSDNDLYFFGRNSPCSQSNSSNKPNINNRFLRKCQEMKSMGTISLDISQNTHEIHAWTYESRGNEFMFNPPIILNINNKAYIESISCGKEFAILLSNKGILYSIGTKNNKGELATGDLIPRFEPYPLFIFTSNKERIISVSCGYKHVICLSAHGTVFSWGSNSNGQLGLREKGNYPTPMRIEFEHCFNNNNKIIQITAGLRSSFFMNENRNIGYCGKTGLGSTYIPERINLKNLLLNQDLTNDKLFTPIRLMSSYNNSFSLFYITYADLRTVTHNKTITMFKLTNFLLSLSQKWTNSQGI